MLEEYLPNLAAQPMPAVANFEEERIDFVMRAWLASAVRSNLLMIQRYLPLICLLFIAGCSSVTENSILKLPDPKTRSFIGVGGEVWNLRMDQTRTDGGVWIMFTPEPSSTRGWMESFSITINESIATIADVRKRIYGMKEIEKDFRFEERVLDDGSVIFSFSTPSMIRTGIMRCLSDKDGSVVLGYECRRAVDPAYISIWESSIASLRMKDVKRSARALMKN